jgi:hypothetical protein
VEVARAVAAIEGCDLRQVSRDTTEGGIGIQSRTRLPEWSISSDEVPVRRKKAKFFLQLSCLWTIPCKQDHVGRTPS